MSTKKDDWWRPVFIVGFPRTGTTLLYRILHRHSAFFPLLAIERPGYNAVIETKFGQRFFNYGLGLWFADENQSLRDWFAGSDAAYTCFLLDCFRAFHLRAVAVRGSRRILEKTPGHILICEFMVRAFPQAQFLCTWRDPADTLASWRRRRAIQTGPDGAWLDLGNDLDAFIGRWNKSISTWNDFAAIFPKHCLVVDYEALTTESWQTVDRILTFVGEVIEPDLLSGCPPQQQMNGLDRYDSHIPIPNSGSWREYLAHSEAERLWQQCTRICEAL